MGHRLSISNRCSHNRQTHNALALRFISADDLRSSLDQTGTQGLLPQHATRGQGDCSKHLWQPSEQCSNWATMSILASPNDYTV